MLISLLCADMGVSWAEQHYSHAWHTLIPLLAVPHKTTMWNDGMMRFFTEQSQVTIFFISLSWLQCTVMLLCCSIQFVKDILYLELRHNFRYKTFLTNWMEQGFYTTFTILCLSNHSQYWIICLFVCLFVCLR